MGRFRTSSGTKLSLGIHGTISSLGSGDKIVPYDIFVFGDQYVPWDDFVTRAQGRICPTVCDDFVSQDVMPFFRRFPIEPSSFIVYEFDLVNFFLYLGSLAL